MNILNLDQVLQGLINTYTKTIRIKHSLGLRHEKWEPGKKLKLLMVGYNGTRNTGADVRVTEIIRQFRHIMGKDQVELSLMTFNPQFSANYFPGTKQVSFLPQTLPKFLHDQCTKHHGVVTCEGSMFKSKFTDALSTIMAGSLGLASVEGKLSTGYGAEVGDMTVSLRRFVKKQCQNSLIICRNESSRVILNELGIQNTGGTDTAWTFEPAPLKHGAKLLKKAGWDGKRKILIACPINPFWWPVKPSINKLIGRYLSGKHKDLHYLSVYFHQYSDDINYKYKTYIAALAEAIQTFSREQNIFPVIIGMEKLDRLACEHLAAQLYPSPPYFVSDSYNMYDLVSILHNASYLVSSRYHAIITSMPAQVASIGVSMDERIRNLMYDRGHPELLLAVDDLHLGEKLIQTLRQLTREKESISAKIGRMIPHQLRLMGEMGIYFMDEVTRIYPAFPRPNRPRHWEAYLPPLSPRLNHLLEKYA